MKVFVALLGTAGLGASILVLVILARLTQKWEVVAKVRSGYRLFYVAAALVTLASLTRLVRTSNLGATGTAEATISALGDPRSWFYLCFYHLPLALGMTISLVLTLRNWGWLLREREG